MGTGRRWWLSRWTQCAPQFLLWIFVHFAGRGTVWLLCFSLLCVRVSSHVLLPRFSHPNGHSICFFVLVFV